MVLSYLDNGGDILNIAKPEWVDRGDKTSKLPFCPKFGYKVPFFVFMQRKMIPDYSKLLVLLEV